MDYTKLIADLHQADELTADHRILALTDRAASALEELTKPKQTDYTELVKALRCCTQNPPETCVGCTYNIGNNECAVRGMMCDAAAAIEALQAQLPKQGEVVRCKECIHFTQGGWCDREFDWFPVDGNDFCSMAEKMEVQE